MNKNERLHALKILTRLLTEKSSLSQLMPATAEVTPMTKEICFGFCRHYFRLHALAECLLTKKTQRIGNLGCATYRSLSITLHAAARLCSSQRNSCLA